jgi:hypothetical protein
VAGKLPEDLLAVVHHTGHEIVHVCFRNRDVQAYQSRSPPPNEKLHIPRKSRMNTDAASSRASRGAYPRPTSWRTPRRRHTFSGGRRRSIKARFMGQLNRDD